MKSNKKLRIFIGLPESFEVNKLIERNLELLGFEVINISFPEHHKIHKTFLKKIKYIFRKHILNDRNYKSILKFEPYKTKIHQQIDNLVGTADYTLLFRADIYPLETILKLKSKSNSMVTYHWDGLHRFPAISKRIPYFDRFFVFDPKDVDKSFLPTTNFYFDSENDNDQTKPIYDLYFMGSFITKRMTRIQNFLNSVKTLNLTNYFHVYSTNLKKQQQFPHTEIHYTSSHISYRENIENIKKSKIIIDFLNGAHEGLSFRVFECIQFNKKLITDNTTIINYDFYHPNNIFIWDGNNIEDLKKFLTLEYQILPKIKETYCFSNWIKYILNRPTFIPISLTSD